MAVPGGTGINLNDLLAGAPPMGGSTNQRSVYTGAVSPQGEHSGPGAYTNGSVGVDSAMTMFTGFAPSEQQALTNKLYRAGILDSPDDIQGAYAAWQKAVDYAADAYTFGGKQLTPWDVLQQQIGATKAALAKKQGPITTNSTSTVTDVLTNGDADAMIHAMYTNELGRDPSAGELSRYRSMLINKSKSSPQVTTTHSVNSTSADGTVHTDNNNVTHTGGVSQAALTDSLQQDVHADPEYGAYQAATTYMGALQSLMGGSPNLTSPGG